MLPLSNAIYYPSDLVENAIQVFGEMTERLTMKITSYFMPKV
jgi:hypothetical protein